MRNLNIGVRLCLLFYPVLAPFAAPVQPQDFFHGHPAVAYQIKKNGSAPSIVLFNDGKVEQALAFTLNSAAKAAEKDPALAAKMPIDTKLTLTLENMVFRRDSADPASARVCLQGNLREVELPGSVKVSELLAGKTLTINIPERQGAVGGYSIRGSGRLVFQYHKAVNQVQVVTSMLLLNVVAPFVGEVSDRGYIRNAIGTALEEVPVRAKGYLK